MFERNKLDVKGHILIRDKATHEVIIDKDNSINYENMSLSLARSLANKDPGPVYQMAFGNGGSSVDSLGVITYLEPNTIGQNSTLYNQTYAKVIDDNSAQNTDTTQNFITVEHTDTKFYTDIVATATLDFGEPTGQSAFDTSTTFSETYVFDELCLLSSDGLMLTHVIFHPVQKSLNRVIEIIYTLRITVT